MFFKLRGLLMVPPMVLLTLCVWHETENELLVFGLGGLLFLAGLTLRVWSQMHLHYRLQTKTLLTTTGPYRFVRNPIYIANVVMLTASCFLAELFWFAPIMMVYAAGVYFMVVRHEEAHLLAKYGAPYKEYTSAVPRWLPLRRPAGENNHSSVMQFMRPSMWAECHNLLLLLPFLIKEFLL